MRHRTSKRCCPYYTSSTFPVFQTLIRLITSFQTRDQICSPAAVQIDHYPPNPQCPCQCLSPTSKHRPGTLCRWSASCCGQIVERTERVTQSAGSTAYWRPFRIHSPYIRVPRKGEACCSRRGYSCMGPGCCVGTTADMRRRGSRTVKAQHDQ